MAECDSLAAKLCDTNTYCNPSNRAGDGVDPRANGRRLLCQPASSRGGKRKKVVKFVLLKNVNKKEKKEKHLKNIKEIHKILKMLDIN